MQSVTLSTAQHREMLDEMLAIFQITPDIDLNIMQPGQTLAQLTENLLAPLTAILERERPSIVLTQGDTTTALMVSLASFYLKIPVGHIEAGLRTMNPYYPFPEEMNRTLISRIASLHFAPTQWARENLIREGTKEECVFVTGNTVIDAMQFILRKKIDFGSKFDLHTKMILVTAHRRENFGERLQSICEGVLTLAKAHPELQFIYPVHPNPDIKPHVEKLLGGVSNILLTEPLRYDEFVMLMKSAYLILSDSGGVQEEASPLGTPLLILREATERPEAVEVGAAKLIGTDKKRIVREVEHLLNNPAEYRKMIISQSLYGDGTAGQKISEILHSYLC